MRRPTVAAAVVLLLLMNPSCSNPGPDPPPAGAVHHAHSVAFAYFTGEGETGMHLALGDGATFADVHPSVIKPLLGAGLLRDPSIVCGPDGRWHAVWTTGWWDRGFGVAHSQDLLTWTEPEWAPVMEGVPDVVNTWAPEIHWDPERREYLALWASTVRGRFPETEGSSEPGPDGVGLNHRIWCATTPDFASWSEPRVFFDPGFNVIDAAIVHDAPRRRWVMVFKDETLSPEPRKNLRLAFADRMQGDYTPVDRAIVEAGSWVEGPTVLADEAGWIIFFDRYREGRFGAVRTSDWSRFEAVDPPPVLPPGARHGCVVPISAPGSGGAPSKQE